MVACSLDEKDAQGASRTWTSSSNSTPMPFFVQAADAFSRSIRTEIADSLES
jgi:hypothetical protein